MPGAGAEWFISFFEGLIVVESGDIGKENKKAFNKEFVRSESTVRYRTRSFYISSPWVAVRSNGAALFARQGQHGDVDHGTQWGFANIILGRYQLSKRTVECGCSDTDLQITVNIFVVPS